MRYPKIDPDDWRPHKSFSTPEGYYEDTLKEIFVVRQWDYFPVYAAVSYGEVATYGVKMGWLYLTETIPFPDGTAEERYALTEKGKAELGLSA
jgi:hypothetical protein